MRPQLATEVGDWMVTVILILLCYIYNTAPTPQLEASVCNTNGWEMFRLWRTGAVQRCSFVLGMHAHSGLSSPSYWRQTFWWVRSGVVQVSHDQGQTSDSSQSSQGMHKLVVCLLQGQQKSQQPLVCSLRLTPGHYPPHDRSKCTSAYQASA